MFQTNAWKNHHIIICNHKCNCCLKHIAIPTFFIVQIVITTLMFINLVISFTINLSRVVENNCINEFHQHILVPDVFIKVTGFIFII